MTMADPTQTPEALKRLCETLGKGSTAIYLATEKVVADDVSKMLREAAAAISALMAERDAVKSEVVGQNIDRHYSRQEQVERAERAEARVAQLEARYESDVPRAGPALARVRELLKSRGTVTSSELCAMLPDIPAKTVHNSLAYLKRRGIANSDGYGKYYSIARSTSQGGETDIADDRKADEIRHGLREEDLP